SKNIASFKAKLATIDAIFADYESRIKMLNSPYYVLLAGKDMAELSEKELRKKLNEDHVQNNDALKEYIESLIDRKKADQWGRGESASELYEANKKKELMAEYEATKKSKKEILKLTGYKDTASVLKDKDGFNQALGRNWIIKAREKYNPADYEGTFAKAKQWEGKTKEIEENDKYFSNYYVYELSKLDLGMLSDRFFRREKDSIYPEKERKELLALKDLIDDSVAYIASQYQIIHSEYRYAINPGLREAELKIRDEYAEAERQKDKERKEARERGENVAGVWNKAFDGDAPVKLDRKD
ncbi:MAG: hypothetical protein J6N76_08690, partial [Lachnospiraceae bacterium]|nr:hypothetical protein [Lachnospiraceae bacterium]